MEFKKFNGEKIDLVTYVGNYCHAHRNIQIMVSTDSQCHGRYTCFATIVALYDSGDGEHGHGAHVISRTWKGRRYKKSEIFDRMMDETMASIDVAKLMRDSGIFVRYVDIDISPEEEAGSNVAFSAAKGWVESDGLECRWKTLCPLSTTMADYKARS